MQEKLHIEEEAHMALLQGKEKGLAFFFNWYYSPLVIYTTSLTGHKEVAKDIASEAFIKLWNNKETITEWRKVKFFLYRVVYNASIDYLREQKSRRKHAAHFLPTDLSEKAILEKLVETETYNHLHSLLQNLPPRSRQIFSMFYFQNKAIKEIAKELGISVNTVKTQKLRAIQTLKQYQGSLYFFIIYSLIFI